VLANLFARRLDAAPLSQACRKELAGARPADFFGVTRYGHALLESSPRLMLAEVLAIRCRIAPLTYAAFEGLPRGHRALLFVAAGHFHAMPEEFFRTTLTCLLTRRRRRRRAVGRDALLKRRTGPRPTNLFGIRGIYVFLHARAEDLAGGHMTLFHAIRNMVALIR
jgi:hypothetical protein